MRAADRRVPKPAAIRFRIRCNGQYHWIRAEQGGRGPLVLENHTREEIRAELVLEALGGEPCAACVQVLLGWRAGAHNMKANERIRKLRWDVERRGETRRIGARVWDPLKISLKWRVLYYVEKHVAAQLRRLFPHIIKASDAIYVNVLYRRGETNRHLDRSLMLPKNIHGSGWSILVPVRWLRLHWLGATMVNGTFVIDIFEERPDGTLVALAVVEKPKR